MCEITLCTKNGGPKHHNICGMECMINQTLHNVIIGSDNSVNILLKQLDEHLRVKME